MLSWTCGEAPTEPDSAGGVGDNVSKSDILRGIVAEKLSTAAREILAVVERTVADYEEEAAGFRREIDRQRRQLELLQPRVKLEALDDQQLFSLYEAGGGQLPDDQTQHKYEYTRVENSGSLGLLGYTEEHTEHEHVGKEEEHVEELDYETASRFMPHKGKSGRRPKKKSQTHILLRICILENSKVDVLCQALYYIYPLRKLKIPRGLQEAEFLDLLRSTYPQLATNEPFDFFLTDKSRKLLPLKVDSLTPEEIERTIRATGNSALYIRLRKEPLEPSANQREDADEDPPSTSDTATLDTRVQSEKEPTRLLLTETDTHIGLKFCILEDPQIDMISPQVFLNYPPQELRCPRGLQEANFLDLLRSTFPQLAADAPFDILTVDILTDNARELKPLRLESLTPEEICRTRGWPGYPVIFVRLKGKEKRTLKRRVHKLPSTADPPTLKTKVQSDSGNPGRPLLIKSDTHVDLKICILEDSDIDMISPSVFQTYPLYELQCPCGLQETNFLNLLRSAFPQLAAAEPFELLTANENRVLEALNVEPLTAEMVRGVVGSTGCATLFVRQKAPESIQTIVGKLDGAKDSLSFAEQTRPHMSLEPNGTMQSGTAFLNQIFQISSAVKTLDDDLRGIILGALPAISEDTQQALIDKLLSYGLQSTQDLKYVNEEDIADLLPALQLRKLLKAFKNESELVTLDLQMIPSPTPVLSRPAALPCSTPSIALPPSNQECSSSKNYGQASVFRKAWPETFQVPWNLMPMEIQSAVAEGKRPSPAARRKMVRILADEMRRHELNPARAQCVTICRKIVHKYPQSFADLCDSGQPLGEGYTSLVYQVKNRIDNLNRTSSFRHHRSSGLKRGPVDTYGCTRFQPSLPPEETDETVERKRQRLEEIYRWDGANVAEREEVTELMKATFCLQRCHINALPAPPIQDLRDRWPYLFTQKGLYTHFELLTDIKVLYTLERSMEECGQTLPELFNKSTNPDVRAILSLGPNLELSFWVVQLLMAHFSEDLEGLILFANASATAADIEKTFQLPASPRLILLAETPGSYICRWMISLEGHIVCEGRQTTFLSGLAAVFSTYYAFNLQYQDEAACTLEFIQRWFIGINPNRGTKAPRGKFLSKQTGKFTQKKTTPVSPRVLTLLKKLMDMNPVTSTLQRTFPHMDC